LKVTTGVLLAAGVAGAFAIWRAKIAKDAGVPFGFAMRNPWIVSSTQLARLFDPRVYGYETNSGFINATPAARTAAAAVLYPLSKNPQAVAAEMMANTVRGF
jgi:hypothetical protein